MDLFDEILSGGEAAIKRLILDRRQETIDVEFKTAAAGGKITKDDRANLGIALSAFSNSMGGTIVWGVLAAKNDDGIDCATDRAPIANIERFHSEITRLISQAIMPRHEGVRTELVPALDTPDGGYLLMRIERSERRPHRCEFGDKRYFKRIGDSSVAMEHYDIEDSFRRLVVPTFKVEPLLTRGNIRGGPDGNFVTLMLNISLRNTSTVSARFPYLIIESTNNIALSRRNEIKGVQCPPGVFEGGADVVIALGLSMVFQRRKPAAIGEGFPPRLHRARARFLNREGAHRRTLASRDQVRRLSRAAPPRQ